MTEASQHPRPVPNAAHFRLRPVAAEPVEPVEPVVWTTLVEWAELDERELAALPTDTRRTLKAGPGLYLHVIKMPSGSWTLMNRRGISSRVLAGMRTAPRVPIDPEATPGRAT